MEAQVSHILLTSTTAALQGELAFARVMARFTGANRAARLVENVTSVLDEARKWWKDLEGGIPLIRTGPELTADGKRVTTLLRSAISRWERLAERTEPVLAAGMPGDADALRFLAALNVDRAFYAQQSVAGTIAAGTMMGDPTVAERLASRLEDCNGEIALANAIADALAGATGLEDELRGALADRSMGAAIELRLRAAEGRRSLGVATGRFDHAAAGIPAEEIEEWRSREVPPAAAAQWRATGFRADEAVEWARNGFDPGEAAVCRLRGVSLADAMRARPSS